ncbi:MAG: hypothetical protein ACT4OW_06635 [Nitrososphaerota archaeon]
MVKPVLLIVGAIPVILAILIAVPMITKPDIPFSAVVPTDKIELEYAKHQLQKISFGVTEETKSQKTEILVIKNDGTVRYSVIEKGNPKPDMRSTIPEEKVRKLTALIKETGFMAIPSESFEIGKDISEYKKSSLKVTLNGQTRQIHWPEQNATSQFIPPIITMVELELDQIISSIQNSN